MEEGKVTKDGNQKGRGLRGREKRSTGKLKLIRREREKKKQK